jgi:branched-chain amino acid transport system ATP-binding protein
MDEPAAGMNTQEKLKLADLIFKVRNSGVTILIVEHNMDLLMGVSDDILVLDFGQKIMEGSPQDIKKNELVIKAYLGDGYQSC